MDYFTYSGATLNEISFPLGGIGGGCIGLAGNGRLIDWEIFNRPNKGSRNGFSHFAIRAESKGEVVDVRAINGDLHPPFTGAMGPRRENLAAMPHFSDCTFEGRFPTATITLKDPKFPGTVRLSAFNPLIPLNEDDSSIPAAFFEVSVTNPTKQKLDYTLYATLCNPLEGGSVNTAAGGKGRKRIDLTSAKIKKTDVKYGQLTVATDAANVSFQENWFRGAWFDALGVYWRDLHVPGRLKNRRYDKKAPRGGGLGGSGDHCTLAAHVSAAPGKTATARFVIAWYFPNVENYWNPIRCESSSCCNDTSQCGDGINHKASRWKNYYVKLFKGSADAAAYCLTQWDRLEGDTLKFRDALFDSDLPAAALDAIQGNIAVLKSPTCLRMPNGELYGFEGCHDSAGCCEGTCTHVWAYEQATPFLFPKLARSMRDLDFKYNYADDGSMGFRLQLPLGRDRSAMRPCVDGQFSGVLKTYREWKISGDDRWLKKHWPKLKKNIEWAWSPENYDRWDANKDGVLEGRQHHTLDMELFGPSSWLNSFYLAALKAGAEMADYLGEPETAAEYRAVLEKGRQWVDKHLFNGSYYHQKLRLNDRSVLDRFTKADPEKHGDLDRYWDAEHKQIKYQIIEGCALDQILGQWHANIYGLGDVLDRKQATKAARALYTHNFKKSMRDVFNPCRVYSLQDEGGLMICDWPEGTVKPHCPLTYAEETMNGFEYAGAITMLQYGLVDEGVEALAAIRDRFDGEKRNPWNEFECGHNYARSMASYAVLTTLSGFTFDMPRGQIGFDPMIEAAGGRFHCFWSLDSGWGVFRKAAKSTELEVQYGSLTLETLSLPYLQGRKITSVTVGGRKVTFEICQSDGSICFDSPVEITTGKKLVVTV